MKNQEEENYFIRVEIKDSAAPARVLGISIEGNLIVDQQGKLIECVNDFFICPVTGIGEFYTLITLCP